MATIQAKSEENPRQKTRRTFLWSQAMLRTATFLASLTSALIMVMNKQTVQLFGFHVHPKYTFLVIANIVACAYSLLSLPVLVFLLNSTKYELRRFFLVSKDGVNVISGDSLVECVSIADSCQKVVAVGINCTPPRFIHGLVLSIRKVTGKPIFMYPNSGETYAADNKEWVESTGVSDEDFVSYVEKWREAGLALWGAVAKLLQIQ